MAKAGKPVLLKRLAKKGLRITLRIPDAATWLKELKADPQIPTSLAKLRRLWAAIKAGRRQKRLFPLRVDHGIIRPRFEECGEDLYYRFFTGLANPGLSADDRARMEADMDADTPEFENSIETDHFILRWTNSSDLAADNIADADIITETGEHLEAAWTRYNDVFGRAPYVPEGAAKIDVNFLDIAGFGVASPPDGPIQFDAQSWVNQPGIRKPTSAHELFHKLQYAFGYRTTWDPTDPYKWFSEGSASWAEVFMWQRVSGAYKMTDLFDNPDTNLYDASYAALPFWMFFDTRQRDAAGDVPLVDFLSNYEVSGDERAALAETIDEDWPVNNVYGQLDHFFALFSRERRIGAWRQTPTGGQPFATILGPDGATITPALALVDVPLASGDTFEGDGAVSGIGSEYHRFVFQPDTDGQTVTISVTGVAGGNYSYYLVWEKAGAFTLAEFPFVATGDYSMTKPIALATADALVLIVSGRGAGGTYTVSASVT